MWRSTLFGSSNAEEDENLLCDEILIRLENHISEAEARIAQPITQWDGHCGLVRISDDELVRPEAPNSNRIAPPDAHQSLLENTTSQEQHHQHHITAPSTYSNNKPTTMDTSTTIPTCEEIIAKAISLPSKSQARQLLYSVLVDPQRRCATVTSHQATLLIDTILKLEGIEGVNIESITEVQRALEWYQAGEVRRCLQQLHAASVSSGDDGVHRELTGGEIKGVNMLRQWIMAQQTHV
jgi:hypothetical protein